MKFSYWIRNRFGTAPGQKHNPFNEIAFPSWYQKFKDNFLEVQLKDLENSEMVYPKDQPPPNLQNANGLTSISKRESIDYDIYFVYSSVYFSMDSNKSR